MILCFCDYMGQHKRFFKEIKCELIFGGFIFTIFLKIKNMIGINNEIKSRSLKKHEVQ